MKLRDPERSEQIIQGAADLFGEFGYNGVRMEDIAARAGVAKGTLYLYFKDKDDLFLALILRRMSNLLEEIRAKAADAPTPEEKLLVLVTECFAYFHSQPHIFAVLERLDHTGSEAQTEALRAKREKFLEYTSSILRELQATGRGAPIDPKISARILCSMMREMLFMTPDPPEVVPRQIVEIFLYGTAIRPRPFCEPR